MHNENTIHANLKALRNTTNKSQSTLAKELNLSVDAYRKWEHGKKSIDILDCHRLADVFELTPVEIFIQLNKGLL
ncbi:MAG: helix-turn-helix domain-containing protein [Nodosilinea sp. WJT8-NPBG4]|jgi:DNA-binding XRE family transcriptional regulator|nr:helix-turn-helix domain-containing protein [Nodosilinea sp. WJT8-NPBG4]